MSRERGDCGGLESIAEGYFQLVKKEYFVLSKMFILFFINFSCF